MMSNQLQDKEMLERLKSVDSLAWASLNKLSLRPGVRFTLDGYKYLLDITETGKREVCVKKGTQTAFTTRVLIYCLHSCIYQKFKQGILYMMPTADTVQEMARSCFNPIIENNSFISKYLSSNTNENKVLNGRPILFVGSQLKEFNGVMESTKFRFFPADVIIRDEYDHIPFEASEMSKQRLNASQFKLEFDIASPTSPDFGIDERYNLSDQRLFQIKCHSCGKYTCLETSPLDDVILKADGRWIRACKHCKAEIFVHDGVWEAEYPERRVAGFWASSLLNPYADLEGLLDRYHRCDERTMPEFLRSVMGIAIANVDCELKKDDVLSRCGHMPMVYNYTGETCMGVDVGKKALHYVIGHRTSQDSYKIVNVGVAETYDEVFTIGSRMGVKSCVIDAMPEYNAAIDFAKKAPFRVYLCYYNDATGEPNFDSKTKVVKANRTQVHDMVYDIYTSGKIELPRANPAIDKMAHQMTQITRQEVANPKTGINKLRWVKKGGSQADDHLFHANAYFVLACKKVSPHRSGTEKKVYTKCKNVFRI